MTNIKENFYKGRLFKENEMLNALKEYIDNFSKDSKFKTFLTTLDITLDINFEKLFSVLDSALFESHLNKENENTFYTARDKVCSFMENALAHLSTNFNCDSYDICEYYASTRVYDLIQLYPDYKEEIDLIRKTFNQCTNDFNLKTPKDLMAAIDSYNVVKMCCFNSSDESSLAHKYLIHTAELIIAKEILLPLKKAKNTISDVQKLANFSKLYFYYINKLLLE